MCICISSSTVWWGRRWKCTTAVISSKWKFFSSKRKWCKASLLNFWLLCKTFYRIHKCKTKILSCKPPLTLTPLLKCHLAPRLPLMHFSSETLFAFLPKIPARPNFESASPSLPLLMTILPILLKKVFDLGERRWGGNSVARGRNSNHAPLLSAWFEFHLIIVGNFFDSFMMFTIHGVITVSMIEVTWELRIAPENSVSHSQGNGVLRLQFVNKQPSQNHSSSPPPPPSSSSSCDPVDKY